MKRIILFLAAALFVASSFPLFAAGIREEREAGVYSAQTGSSVWRVAKNGNMLYLGGSIHILRESDFPLPGAFDIAFSRSDMLVLEADVRQLEDPEIIEYMTEQMFLPDNITLESLLEPDVYELLASACRQHGFPIEMVSNFKPSMITTMLSLLQIEGYGFIQLGVDFYYLEKAIYESMPVIFLESVQTQINMLVTMGDGYENDYVRYSLYDMDNTESLMEILVSDWRNGTAATTEQMLADMRERWPLIYKTMITDRHDAWMPQIKDFLDSGQVYFVIAGLAHMYGPDGLLQLLADYGCTIEQVR
jgi:uncharacterized protein YbaP (TraB family)